MSMYVRLWVCQSMRMNVSVCETTCKCMDVSVSERVQVCQCDYVTERICGLCVYECECLCKNMSMLVCVRVSICVSVRLCVCESWVYRSVKVSNYVSKGRIWYMRV